ncbi:Nephrocystin-4 [Dirofilaria immitis]
MTLMIVTILICALLNISYIIIALIICIKKRKNVKQISVKSKQHKLSSSKKPYGPAPKPADKKVAVTQEAAVAPGVPKQLLQKSPIATKQMQNAINDVSSKKKENVQVTQLSDEQIGNAKDEQRNMLQQRIKDKREQKNGKVRCEQYKSIRRRRKKATKNGVQLEIARTQESNQMEGKLKEDQNTKMEEEEDDVEDDTMKGIASLQQDLNIVSTEE